MAIDRRLLATIALSAAGFLTIVGNEGYTSVAIIPVKGDVPTLGYGTTQGVHLGDTITPPKALARALVDVQKTESGIKQCVTTQYISQQAYDAFVDFSYNVGVTKFCESTLVEKLNAGDEQGACKELMRWNRYQGKDCSLAINRPLCGGLETRREKEYQSCIGVN